MNILVTGGAGFIGTNLIKRLVKEGHNVVSFDDYSTGLRENEVKGCRYIGGSIINDLWTLKYYEVKYDIIYHLAALSRIQPSFEKPGWTFEVNTKGTQEVCEFAKGMGAKLIYAGSSSRWHNPYQSPYALYKYLGEGIVKMYKNVYGLNAEITRFYNVYGPHEIIDGDWAAVIGIWRRQVRDNEPLTIVGDGEQCRDFTHIYDIVDGLYRVGMSNETIDDAWELGTGVSYSLNEVYQMFNKRFNVPCIHIPDQKGNYRRTFRENNAALVKLGWKPQDRLWEYISNLDR